MDRRHFLESLAAQVALGTIASGPRASSDAIDRRARVDRHAPVVRGIDPLAPLSVGNGRFAFTVDVTGVQSLTDAYREIPLATQAEWAWHTFANPNGYTLDAALVSYDAHGRPVPYASAQNGDAGTWLRANPHRLSLARVALALRDRALRPDDVRDVVQRLDLWTGTIESRFTVDGAPVRVLTAAHPERDLIAVRVEGNVARLAVRIAFPYASAVHTGDPADWTHPERHRTDLSRRDRAAATWRHTLDADGYWARAAWSGGSLGDDGPHAWRVTPDDGAAALDVVLAFAPDDSPSPLPDPAAVRRASAEHWARFWTDGAAVDLSGSADPRAPELERRIVLSEYLTAIQCAGTLPPQETGETFDSWYGKFHLEMHPWHAAHFALWNRVALLERSLPWYGRILPNARATARRQGYGGARWPKMVGPDGRESPSSIGPFLVWQQPHPILLAELVYRARPDDARRVLDAHRDVVFATAEFMASYPFFDGRRYVLGPPLIPAQESHPPRTTFNPTFELAYWAFALETAQRWRARLGLRREPTWDRVLGALSPLPTRDGLYVNAESAPTTFTDADQRRDHPSLLGALGFVPASRRADRETMRRTLRRVLDTWQWPETWGWDYPLVAMTAARLGEPEAAVDALLMDTPKNRYLPNGHNYQRPGLTIYLPGNGGVLWATALMAAGWAGGLT
ncbi:hypothetical protein J421_0747 [Gemmatirosa kalamazoonensis]|uniref:Glycoside hydrolase family 65 central catalytic n=1 Tax=Gemmatirosa kalamazoonensis TaxID=861299 RepID=W0RB25_9BACT|nr:hypothetical protein [Gemmatirosa kalamazoonensis]AHG88284.1 hypothetical protein J421_0747 [Gemmatirosa kalamazoonensis]